MAKIRDQLMVAAILSAIEAYIFLHLLPQYKPAGGLGRLTERFLIGNVILLFGYRWFAYPMLFSKLRDIPGPSMGLPPLYQGIAMFKRPPGSAFLHWVNTIPNDGLIYFRGVFGREHLVPTTVETLKTVLTENPYDYEKPGPVANVLRRILGDGLILVEGNVHKFQRKHLTPSFHIKTIRGLYPMFWTKACELVKMIAPEKELPEGAEFEFGTWCARVTLDIIGIAGFGRDFGSLTNHDDPLVTDYNLVLEPDNEKLVWFVLNIVLPPWMVNYLPWYINRELARIQKSLYDFSFNMVQERRKTLAKDKKLDIEGSDILSLLVKSNDFTDHELAAQVLTMMAAGHETTSSTLSWCAFLLAKNPEIQERVRAEVRAALPSLDSGENITAEQIDSLTWLNAVCSETLRLYPTVPLTIRETIKETVLNGRRIPKDTTIILSPWAINRSHHFWGNDSEEFKPERWINKDGTANKTGGSDTNFALMTFLHGPRSCIGQGFAQSELKCLLAAFVGRYSFELSREDSIYFPGGLVTTKPDNGMWLNLKSVPGW